MAPTGTPVIGGIKDVPMEHENDLRFVDLARFAVSEYNKKANAIVEFENIVKVKQQTVAGFMYYITIQVSEGGAKKLYEAKVWEKSWENFKQLMEFKPVEDGATPVMGGIEDVPMGHENDLHFVDLARFAVSEYNKKANAIVEFENIVKVKQQTVAGFMYYITIQVSEGGAKKLYEAKVWEKSWENFEQLMEFKPVEDGATPVMGGIEDVPMGHENDLHFVDLARFAVSEYIKKANAIVEFENIVNVKQQTVAGFMYYITIQVNEGGARKLYEAKVWEKSWENFKQLVEFKPVMDGATPMTGGIEEVPMGHENDLHFVDLARFAISEYNKKANAIVEFENIVKVKQQTVAGFMYYITIQVSEGGAKKLYEAKVWEKSWENFKQLVEFKPVEVGATPVMGGIEDVPMGHENDLHFVDLTRFAVSEYNRKANAIVEFENIVKVKQQTVAGFMYYITIQVSEGGAKKLYEAKVWEKSWENFKQLVEFKPVEDGATPVMGGIENVPMGHENDLHFVDLARFAISEYNKKANAIVEFENIVNVKQQTVAGFMYYITIQVSEGGAKKLYEAKVWEKSWENFKQLMEFKPVEDGATPVMGGIEDVPMGHENDLHFVDLARFAVSEYNKKANAIVEFENIVNVKQQTVAGFMYYITIQVNEGGARKLYEAKVWEKSWENFKQLVEFKPVMDGATPMTGGIEEVPMGHENDLHFVDLARFAVSEYNRKANAIVEFENIVKVKQQTVAGFMYYITIQVSEGGAKKLYEAKVWEKSWENFKQLVEFKPVEDGATPVMGGIEDVPMGHQNDLHFVDLARFAVSEYNRKANAIVEFENIVNVKQQTVAGFMYYSTIQVSEGGAKKLYEAKVWEKSWENFKQLVEFKPVEDGATPVMGGIENVPMGPENDLHFVDLARFAISEYNKKANAIVEFENIVNVKQQTVAGFMYYITIQVSEGGAKKLYEAKVWEKSWENFKQLVEFKPVEDGATPVMGGIEDVPMGHENDLHFVDLARFAISEYNKKANAIVEFENIVNMKQQTVAGFMYYITIQVNEGGARKLYEAKVWEKSWENFKQLVEFKPVMDGATPMTGGIEEVPMGHENDLHFVDLARFAVSEYNKKANAIVEFENIVKVKQQTVAGFMYYITIQVSEGGAKKLYEVKVWEKSWENFKQLVEFKPVMDGATPMTGGIEEVPMGHENDLHFVDLARFSVSEYNKKTNALVEFIKVVKVKRQMVSGIVYYIKIQVSEGGAKKVYEAKVWEKPWENFKQLVEFKPTEGVVSA